MISIGGRQHDIVDKVIYFSTLGVGLILARCLWNPAHRQASIDLAEGFARASLRRDIWNDTFQGHLWPESLEELIERTRKEARWPNLGRLTNC